MDLVTITDDGLGNSSYVLDLDDGGALVLDPARDPRPYLAELERRGLTPRFTVETHLHADVVSGSRELVAHGARLLAPAGSELAFAHEPLDDGDEVDLGGLTLQAVATPGHTPEHLAYLVLDGATPLALFTGGTLIVGGVARTDLLAPEQTEPLARAAYRSITQRLFAFPDDLPVHPTHGAGSFCSAGTGGKRTTTIGRERATNPLLADDADEDTFVRRLLGGLGTYPPYFLELRDVNRAGVPVIGPTPPPIPQLSVDEVASAVAAGARIVDVRALDAFATGHVPGAISNPWRTAFATWLGWLVPRRTPLVVVADDTIDRDDLAWAMLAVGRDAPLGELAGGIASWQAAGRPVARTALVTADELPEGDALPGHAGGRRIVDVRQHAEFAASHVPGAAHVELGRLTTTPDEVPDGPVLLHCGHGERAMSAASLLASAGHRDLAVLAGGPGDLGEVEVSA